MLQNSSHLENGIQHNDMLHKVWNIENGSEHDHMLQNMSNIQQGSEHGHMLQNMSNIENSGRWFSPGTSASSTTKTCRHDIVEILLIVALKHQK